MHKIAIRESASSCGNDNEPSLRREGEVNDCLSARVIEKLVRIFCDWPLGTRAFLNFLRSICAASLLCHALGGTLAKVASFYNFSVLMVLS
jgi:hypothetical protein